MKYVRFEAKKFNDYFSCSDQEVSHDPRQEDSSPAPTPAEQRLRNRQFPRRATTEAAVTVESRNLRNVPEQILRLEPILSDVDPNPRLQETI